MSVNSGIEAVISHQDTESVKQLSLSNSYGHTPKVAERALIEQQSDNKNVPKQSNTTSEAQDNISISNETEQSLVSLEEISLHATEDEVIYEELSEVGLYDYWSHIPYCFVSPTVSNVPPSEIIVISELEQKMASVHNTSMTIYDVPQTSPTPSFIDIFDTIPTHIISEKTALTSLNEDADHFITAKIPDLSFSGFVHKIAQSPHVLKQSDSTAPQYVFVTDNRDYSFHGTVQKSSLGMFNKSFY